MLHDFFHQRIHASLEQLTVNHQRRSRRCAQATSTTEAQVDGRLCVSFATNDYLGLTRHPRVLQAFSETARNQVGAGASALVAGRSEWHVALEETIAQFESIWNGSQQVQQDPFQTGFCLY